MRLHTFEILLQIPGSLPLSSLVCKRQHLLLTYTAFLFAAFKLQLSTKETHMHIFLASVSIYPLSLDKYPGFSLESQMLSPF
jgi:hypothetical protein